jgi:hypothetical protein
MTSADRDVRGLGAPAIEMLDGPGDAEQRAADDDHERRARLRAMAAALGVLGATPRDM